MRLAIVDPPYYGHSQQFYGDLHEQASDYDTLDAHRDLIDRLGEFDGWALHMTSSNLHDILPLCPKDARVMAWVKPFCSWKKNVTVAYAWEPVVVWGGRKRPSEHTGHETVRDWVAANITLQRGLVGAKPAEVVWWLLEVLGAQPDDEIIDMFPGSGAVQQAIDAWRIGKTGGCQFNLTGV